VGLDSVPFSGSQGRIEGEHIAEMCQGVALPASLLPDPREVTDSHREVTPTG